MPYRASPSIPPGMDPAAWQRVIDAMIREARTITNLLATGRPLTRDQLTRAATIRAIMGETAGALTDAGKAADYLFSKHLAPQLHASLNDLDAALAGHAAVAAADYRPRPPRRCGVPRRLLGSSLRLCPRGPPAVHGLL